MSPPIFHKEITMEISIVVILSLVLICCMAGFVFLNFYNREYYRGIFQIGLTFICVHSLIRHWDMRHTWEGESYELLVYILTTLVVIWLLLFIFGCTHTSHNRR